jgi:GNAT superfamily N-acetyltransferase
MVIREAEARDVPAILGIYRAAEIEGDDGFSVDEATAHLERFRAYPNYKVFVVELGGEVFATYALLIMDNLAKRGRPSGIVEDVAVMPGRQGTGIGRAMMTHAMEQCRAAGCYKLALSSNLRRTDAHDFYDALGFERHGYSFVVTVVSAEKH